MKVYRVKRQLDGSVDEKLGLSKRFETVTDSGSGGACLFQQPLWHHSREAMLISLVKANICRQLRISPSDAAAVQAEVEQLATDCGNGTQYPAVIRGLMQIPEKIGKHWLKDQCCASLPILVS